MIKRINEIFKMEILLIVKENFTNKINLVVI